MAYELIKVSELPELTTPSDPNVLPIQDGDYLKRISFENLKKAAVGDMEGSLAAAYDSTATYAVGDYCIYEGQLYRCTTAITTAEAWTAGHWTAAVLTDDIASDLSAEASTRSTSDNALAADIAEALGDLAAVYSTSATYAVGDYCIYQGQLYRCTTAITTAEAWTSGHWSAVALGDDTRDLRSALGNVNVLDLFEVGDISMTTNGWTYGNNNARVRTRNGITLPMKAGTKIGLADYTDASYYVGWRYGNNQYSMRGWLSAEYETPVDGEYVILIKSNSSTAQIDQTTLASLFYGYNAVAFDYIDKNSAKLDEFEKVTFTLKNGYIASNGSIVSTTENGVVYTNKIPIENGYTFDLYLQYTEVRSMWVAYALYDSNGDFISRTVLKESNVPQFKAFLTISDLSAKYISFTYRSFNESTIVIKTDKNLKILERTIFENVNDPLSNLPSLQNKIISLNAEKAVRGIAHRGYDSVAPENTASAFIEAAKAGFTTIETDIRFTSDNVPVLIHDATVDRTSNGTGNVADMTLQQLKTLDFGSWFNSAFTGEKILTLSEGIELCKKLGLKMLLENKTWGGATDADLRGTIANAIKRYAYKDSVMIMYDAAGALANFATELPNVPLVLLQNDIYSEITAQITTLKNVTNSVYVAVNYVNITTEKIETILNLDAKILLWTIDTESTIKSIDIGVSGIVSNSLNASVVLYNDSTI